MQQRQLRLGDILDDYCPRERRVTNHAVVAMVGDDVKQTRCTTCDAEHPYKHARVPRQRKKSDLPAALYAQVLAGGPKKVPHGAQPDEHDDDAVAEAATPTAIATAAEAEEPIEDELSDEDVAEEDEGIEEGPVHRPLIRAQLPRIEGQPPPTRPAPDFTIRQPGGRANRFRPRGPRGGGPFQGNRTNGNFAAGGPMRGGQRQGGGRPPMASRPVKRHGHGGRKRSK